MEFKLFYTLIIFIGVIGESFGHYGIESNPYRHTQVLDTNGKYVLSWEVDRENEKIYFNVTVETRGYIGFGLSKKGKMSGADIVIGGVGDDGRPYFTDRHAIGNNLPVIDDRQDWTLHTAWESHTHTFLSFSRKFETCDDDHDLPINDDVLALIWAFGEEDNEIEYHHQNRGVFNAYLLDPDLTPQSLHEISYRNVSTPIPVQTLGDWKVWHIPIEQVIPAQDTAYMCTFHKAPKHKSKQHIVGYRSVLNGDLERKHIHHFLLHTCYPPEGVDPDKFFGRYLDQPARQCYVLASGNYGIPAEYCREVKHEWAVGAGPVFFPEIAGIPFSEKPNEFYMLQMHYDNPESLPNVRLQFSLEVYYTDKLREHDAGLFYIGVGTPGSPTLMIPPASPEYVMYGHCAAGCTRKMFPEAGINIFAAKLHTHLAGRGTRFYHIQDNRELPLLIDDNYNFNFQPIRILPKERKVYPGDMLVKRCVYDTTDRGGNATVGGFATRNEMCNGFIWYYPLIRSDIYGVCASEIRSSVYRDFLQINNVTWNDSVRENIVTSPKQNAGLRVSQVGTNIKWTLEKRKELQTHHRFLPQISTCPSLGPDASGRVISSRRDKFELANKRGYDWDDPSHLDGEIRDPVNEFVSLWPQNLIPYKRSSSCLRYQF